MIYRFRITSAELKNFYRIIEIRDDQNFLEFNNAILDSVKFDRNQITSFYVHNERTGRQQEITVIDMSVDLSNKPLMMDKTRLNEHIKIKGTSFIFTYDFFADRSFEVVLEETKAEGSSRKYPVCVESEGKPPQQVKFDDDIVVTTPLLKDEFDTDFGDDEDEEKEDDDSFAFDNDDEEDDIKYKDEYADDDKFSRTSNDYDDD